MNTFSIGPEIIYDKNALDYLKNIKRKKVFIVTDQSMLKLGILDPIIKIMKENHMTYDIFSDVEPDPSMDIVKTGLAQFMRTKPDCLIAVGGGSVIDAAKAIIYFYVQIQKEFLEDEQVNKALFIAIPTTSGTGSEVTSYSVVTDTENEVKIPLRDSIMIPDVAILEEKLIESVPSKITADTGMDVLTHALESLVAKNATVLTDMLAEKAIKLTFTYLPKAYHDGHDLLARRNLHVASCLAGIAFENAALGINHSLAHSIGAKFHISHGRSNAILLPYVIAYNAGITDGTTKDTVTAKKYSQAAAWIDCPADTTMQGVKNLINEILKLNETLSIPASFKKNKIDEDIFEKYLPEIGKIALGDICTSGNPKDVTETDLLNVLRSAY